MDYLALEKPDFVCLQELKAFEDQAPDMHFENSGLNAVWHSAERPGYSGVGTFFPEDFGKHEIGMGDSSVDSEGRVIVSDLGDFYLINTYVPNGAASEERHLFKMRFMESFLELLKDLDKRKPVIWAGDVNIAHRSVDIHDPIRLDGTSGFKPEEREWMDSVEASGFRDAYRLLYPDARDQYSWWSYRAAARQRNKGWRIDYFIVSERLGPRINRVEMHQKVTGSDHCPLLIEID